MADKEVSTAEGSTWSNLPQEIESCIVSSLDSSSRLTLRQCSKATRITCDKVVTSVQVLEDSEQPEKRPPGSAVDVERWMRGLRFRGCKPTRMTLRLSTSTSEAEGLAVLGAFSGVRTLKEMFLHRMPLGSKIAVWITGAAPGLTKLRLSGAPSDCASLAESLPAVLQAAPQLDELEISVLQDEWRAPADSVEHPAWPALRDHDALTQLKMTMEDAQLPERLPSPPTLTLPSLIIQGVASLTRLRSLSLVAAMSSEMALSDVNVLAGSLHGLRSLSLAARALPDHLLQRLLAAWPQLESLSLSNAGSTDISHTSRTSRCLEHVSALCQLTALTHLSLGYPLSISSVQQAMHADAWRLPPGIRELHINAPFHACELVIWLVLVVPPTLTKVTLSPQATLQLGRFTAQSEVEALQPIVAAWKLTHLALRGAVRDPLDDPDNFQWIHLLAPMQLRSLELYDMQLSSMELAMMADGLSPTLEELKLERCTLSFPGTPAALLRLHRLRTLIMAYNNLDGMPPGINPGLRFECGLMDIPRLRRKAALAKAAASGVQAAAGPGPTNSQDSIRAARAEAEAEAAEAEAETEGEEAETEAEAARAEAEAEGAEGYVESKVKWFANSKMVVSLEVGMSLFKAALLVLLARRVNVQLVWDHAFGTFIQAVSSDVLQIISGEGAGAEWGRLEAVCKAQP